MTIKTKTIRVNAETNLEEFNNVKDFLSNLDEYSSYVNFYVVAYVLLKDYGYDAIKITSVKIDSEAQKVFIEFESEYHKEEDIKND